METWDDPHKAHEYLHRVGQEPHRLAGEGALVEVLPTDPRSVLDLGCGDGRVAAVVLEARPEVQHVVAIDVSPPMLTAARERFVHDARVEVLDRSFAAPLESLGRFDVVVSGFAIHHVDHARKRSLFAEIAEVLEPGGVFANLEIVASPTHELHAAFRAAIGRSADDPQDQLAGVEEQLDWMREAGLVQVDCIWKWRGFALLVGEAPTS